MIYCMFDLFYPHPPKPTFDLFLTYFNVLGVSGPLGGLLLHNSQRLPKWGARARGGGGGHKPVLRKATLRALPPCKAHCKTLSKNPSLGDSFITTAGADASGVQCR